MGPFGLRIGLGHIRPFLRLAVISRPIAVVDVARRIHPHQTRSASRRLRHRRSLRSWRRLSRRSRSSRCSRSWSGRRLRSRSRRCSWSCSGRRLRSSLCRRSRRIPLLHTLVPTASPLFAGSRRVSPVFTLTGRSGRCSGRCLSHRYLCRQKPRRNRHKTNRYLHMHSR